MSQVMLLLLAVFLSFVAAHEDKGAVASTGESSVLTQADALEQDLERAPAAAAQSGEGDEADAASQSELEQLRTIGEEQHQLLKRKAKTERERELKMSRMLSKLQESQKQQQKMQHELERLHRSQESRESKDARDRFMQKAGDVDHDFQKKTSVNFLVDGNVPSEGVYIIHSQNPTLITSSSADLEKVQMTAPTLPTVAAREPVVLTNLAATPVPAISDNSAPKIDLASKIRMQNNMVDAMASHVGMLGTQVTDIQKSRALEAIAKVEAASKARQQPLSQQPSLADKMLSAKEAQMEVEKEVAVQPITSAELKPYRSQLLQVLANLDQIKAHRPFKENVMQHAIQAEEEVLQAEREKQVVLQANAKMKQQTRTLQAELLTEKQQLLQAEQDKNKATAESAKLQQTQKDLEAKLHKEHERAITAEEEDKKQAISFQQQKTEALAALNSIREEEKKMAAVQNALRAQLKAEEAKATAMEQAEMANHKALQAVETDKQKALTTLDSMKEEEKREALAAIEKTHQFALEVAEREKRSAIEQSMKMAQAQSELQAQLDEADAGWQQAVRSIKERGQKMLVTMPLAPSLQDTPRLDKPTDLDVVHKAYKQALDPAKQEKGKAIEAASKAHDKAMQVAELERQQAKFSQDLERQPSITDWANLF